MEAFFEKCYQNYFIETFLLKWITKTARVIFRIEN
jgi:hypothetical protein